MTTLDSGNVIIKKGEGGGGVTINNQDKVVDITENGTTEVVADGGFTGLGKVTINTEVSGGGADLEGEYFLAKPNGRYWKFTFSPPPSNQYVNPNSLSAEQLKALLSFCQSFETISVIYGAAVCSEDAPLDSWLRVDGVGLASANLGVMHYMLFPIIYDNADISDIDTALFNSSFFSVWKECSVKTSTITETVPFYEYDLVSFIKQLVSMEGMELTDEQIMMMLASQFMLIPATEEEYKAARREN